MFKAKQLSILAHKHEAPGNASPRRRPQHHREEQRVAAALGTVNNKLCLKSDRKLNWMDVRTQLMSESIMFNLRAVCFMVDPKLLNF